MITTTSGLIAPVTDRNMMETQDGTYVWEYSQEDCPDSIVQLYLGSIKVLSNSSTSYVGGLAIVEGSEKDQVAGLELTESFLLCGRAAMRTHIKNIVIFFHPMSGIQVASGKFSTATGEAEVTRLESEVSFLQVKATMSLKERIRQVKAEICDNQRQIAHVRLESLAGAENPYSLMYSGEDTRSRETGPRYMSPNARQWRWYRVSIRNAQMKSQSRSMTPKFS
jgi:hypothetical protein